MDPDQPLSLKNAEIETSKWGRFVDLEKHNATLPNSRNMAFLEYGLNAVDFPPGTLMEATITFQLTYVSITKNSRNWASISGTTYQKILSHPEFTRMDLKETSIMPVVNPTKIRFKP